MTKILTTLIAVFLLAACQQGTISLVTNGQSDYRIVIPAAATDIEHQAASELQNYLQEISGATLPIVNDDTAPATNEILIGNARATAQKAINKASLQEAGFHLKTEDNKLIIAGGSGKGTLFGVYGFLEDHLGCRKYSSAVSYIPEMPTIQLKPIDDIQVPIFQYRDLHMPDPIGDSSFTAWHKLHARPQRQKSWGMWVHTFDDLVPPERYFQTHPEYFSLINGERSPNFQLCLTNPEVLELVINGLQERMQEKPEARYWSVSQNDTYGPCQCESCAEIDNVHGGPSGSIVSFVNKVAAQFPDKIISTLAYQYSRSAPVDILPAENVNIVLCSIECNRSESIVTDSRSASFRRDIVEWGKLTDNILIWDYTVQFRNYVDPFPNLRVLQPNLQFFAANNARLMFQQGSGTSWSEFYQLRTYIIAKLLWNPDVDVSAIIDDFLNGFYGDAGQYLRQYIERTHDALTAAGDDLQIYGYPYDGIDSYLTPALIQEYIQLFDAAEAAVADDPQILQRVKNARLPLKFAILEISKRNVDEFLTLHEKADGGWQVKPAMRQRLSDFIAGVKTAGIERLEEHGTSPDEYQAATEAFFEKGFIQHLAYQKPVTLHTTHSEKYPVGGAVALTDGLTGINDYHFNWLGFEAHEMDAVIDLGEEREIKEISANFLQDYGAWIWLPQSVEFLISSDGEKYVPLPPVQHRATERNKEKIIETFRTTLAPTKTRYIRVKTNSRIHCPDWHIGAGGDAWIFCDEVIVR